jgi:ERCC4-type nuclease
VIIFLKIQRPIEMALIVDDREGKKIIPLLVGPHLIKRLTVGDFAIQNEGKLVCVIERKSWKDLAQSIKDGRYKKQKDALLLQRSVCQCYLLIEGKNIRTGKICGVPVKTLLTITRKSVLRGIQVIYTRDPQHTAEYLELLRQDVVKMGSEIVSPHQNHINWLESKDLLDKVEDGVGEDPALFVTGTHESLNRRVDTSLFDLWCAIPGVGPKTATGLMDTYTIARLVRMTTAELAESTVDGRRLGEARAKKIKRGLIDRGLNILLGIKGVTPVIINVLSRKWDLRDILNIQQTELENIRRGGRRIGRVGTRIYKCLRGEEL